jgi:hypothetical protein
VWGTVWAVATAVLGWAWSRLCRPATDVGEVLGSGLVTRLHDRVYARLRHGRLVVVGGPGAGKTAAMILLLLEALGHRGAGDRS